MVAESPHDLVSSTAVYTAVHDRHAKLPLHPTVEILKGTAGEGEHENSPTVTYDFPQGLGKCIELGVHITQILG